MNYFRAPSQNGTYFNKFLDVKMIDGEVQMYPLVQACYCQELPARNRFVYISGLIR